MMIAGTPLPAPALVESATAAGYEGPDLTLYLLTCALVIGAICGLGLLLRKLLARTIRDRAQKRSLQVRDVLPLGGKQRLVVVRCYDRTFLLGLGDKEVRAIAELDAEETLAPEVTDEERIVSPHPVENLERFEELLRKNTNRSDRRATSKGRAPSAAPRQPVLEKGRGILG